LKSGITLTFGALLECFVEIHDRQVDGVKGNQDECLVPLDALVVHNTDENGHRDSVGNAVPCQWPPVQGYGLDVWRRLEDYAIRRLGHRKRTTHTIPAPMPQQAATAKMLNTADPTIVPTPISPSVMKVPITLTNSSGAEVAAAMNVAPATSLDMLSAS